MRGKVSDIDKELLRRDGFSELEHSGYKLTSRQFWERTLQFETYEPVDSTRDQLAPTTIKVTTRIPAGLITNFRESLSNKGALPAKEVDGWVDGIVRERRRERMASVTVPPAAKDQKVETINRPVSSTWSELVDVSEAGSRGWSTGMGFEFLVSTKIVGQ